MLESIGQIAINVKDTARARLMLSPPSERDHDHPGSIIYYKVADLAATHAAMAAKGAAFEQAPHRVATMPDHELWMAFLRDSEGNLLALMEEKRPG